MQTEFMSPQECLAILSRFGMSNAQIARSVSCCRGTIDNIRRGGNTSFKTADKLRRLVADRRSTLSDLFKPEHEEASNASEVRNG